MPLYQPKKLINGVFYKYSAPLILIYELLCVSLWVKSD